MSIQSTIRQFPTDGFIGDFALSGPIRSRPIVLKTADPTLNVLGRAATMVAGNDNNAVVGGTGAFAGILSNSKQYALYGGVAPLAPTLTLANDMPVQATTLTSGMYVTLSTTANIGDGVAYNNTTGVLAAAPGGTAPSGHTTIQGASVIRRNITTAGTTAIIQLLHGGASVVTSGPLTVANSMDASGDSTVAYGEPALAGSSGGQTSVSSIGIINDASRLAGGLGFNVVGFFAVGGTTPQQWLATQVPQMLASPAKIAYVGTGVNGYNDALSTPLGGPYTQAQILAAIQSGVNQLVAVKDLVYVRTINPVSQSGSTGAKGRASEFPSHNAALVAMFAGNPKIRVIDSYTALVDPASGVFNPKPNLIRADDGIHETTWGARTDGEATGSQMFNNVTLTPYKAVGPSLLNGFNTTTGGTATAGTGTVNGTANIPASWNVQIVSGSAAVTVSQPVANTVRLAVSNPGGTASTIYLQYASVAALFAQVTPGTDTIQAGVDFAVTGATALTRVAVTARENGGSPLWNAMARDTTIEPDAVFKYNQADQVGRRWTHPRLLPSGTTGVELLLAINVGAAGAVTIDFSNPTYHKLT